MYSSVTRLTGLASGMDTDAMIRQLMNAESMKMNKLKQKRQLMEWRQQSYREVSLTLATFQSSFTSLAGAGTATSLRLASNFQSLQSTVKNSDGTASTAVKARSASAAAAGSFSVDVKQVAAKDTYRGSTVDMTYSAQSSYEDAKASVDRLRAGDSFTVNLDGGTTATISMSALDFMDDSPEGLANAINAKLRDRFGYDVGPDGKLTTNQKVSFKYDAKTDSMSFVAGAGHSVKVDSGASGSDALAKLGFEKGGTTALNAKTKLEDLPGMNEKQTIRFSINGTNFTFDKTDTLEKVMNDVNKSGAGVTLSFDTMQSAFKMESNESGAANAISFSDTDGFLANALGMKDSYTGKQQANDFKLSWESLDNDNNPVEESLRLWDTDFYKDLMQEGDGGALTGPEYINFKINGHEFSFAAGATIESIMETVSNSGAGVNMAYNESTRSFTLNSTGTGNNNRIEIEDTDGFLNGFMGFDPEKPTTSTRSQAAADAMFIYNGTYVTRETNVFEFNGVELTLTEAAAGKKFDIELSRDIEPTMDLIKKFVTEYNNMVDTLNNQVSTSRSKNGKYGYYEPLTEDQRSAMSDREVELWETEAKKGTLYRDELLTKLAGEFRSMIYAPVTRADGSSIALYDLGITTSSSNRYIGKLQIDETKLRNALENNADAVSDLFTKQSEMSGATPEGRKARLNDEGLGDRLNDIIRNAIDIGGSIYKKAGTDTYKDSDIHKELERQDNQISDMLDYLISREDYYYSMFSRMETAMSQANSQMESLMSLLG